MNSYYIPFLFCVSLFLIACTPNLSNKSEPELSVSHWNFESEPSCVNILSDSVTVAVGSENGYLYLIKDEIQNKVCISLGNRIYKVEYLGEKENLNIYLISVRHKGLHIVGIDKDNMVRTDIVYHYENDELPLKGDRYTAYDWFKKGDNSYFFATSNGLWTSNISLDNINLSDEIVMMRRIGSMGMKKSQYAITSVSSFNDKIYFSSQDGFWEFDSIPKRISTDSIKYNCIIPQEDKLLAFNDNTIITLYRNGDVKTAQNDYKAKFLIPVNDSTTYYFANNKLYVNNRPEEFDLRVTQYAKNTFAVSFDQGNPEGIYMIQGNDLVYVDIQLVMMYNPTIILGICEDKKDSTAYIIDGNWNLYRISDHKFSLIGQVSNVREPITEMIVMTDFIYLITDYFLYKIPTKAGLSRNISAEKIDIFKQKADIDVQTERMVTLYDQDRNASLLIGTRAHLWDYDLSSPVSRDNPAKLHIRAKTITSPEPQDLDQLYESCNVQAIAKYPYKNSSDLLVGTRDFGIVSYDRNSINTLHPESWLGLNKEHAKNIKSINVLSAKGKDKIKILISSDEHIHLVTFKTNTPNTVSSIPYFAKNVFFIEEDLAIAVSEFGGISLFDVSTDSIKHIEDYYKKIHFKPQFASLKESVLLNSNSGPYLFDKHSNKLSILDLTPKDSGNIYYIYSVIILISLLLCYFIIVRILRLRKYTFISRQLEEREIAIFGKSSQAKILQIMTKSLKHLKKTVTLEELIRRSEKLLKWLNEEYKGAQLLEEDILILIKQQPDALFNFDDQFHILRDNNSKYVIYDDVLKTLKNIYYRQYDLSLEIDITDDFKKVFNPQSVYVTIDKLIQRMSSLTEWWSMDSNKNRSSFKFKNPIDELIDNRLSNNYDFSEKLKILELEYIRHFEIKEIYNLLPSGLKITDDHDINRMAKSISKAIGVIRFETNWLRHAAHAYTNLIANEQKIGKGNINFWQQILESFDRETKQPLYNSYIQQEIKTVLELHPYSNYHTLILSNADCFKNYIRNFPVIDIPQQNEVEDLDYIVNNNVKIKSIITAYFTHDEVAGQRENLIKDFVTEKKEIEHRLCDKYLEIINMSHKNYKADRSKLIDYFKNLTTYLYYQLFVIGSEHILNYNEKEHRYDSFYDFQQQIIILSTFLNNDSNTENLKYDMRPLILQDKLYLTIEGSDSKENSISKFKDKTKTLHMSFYKKTEWDEYPVFVNLLFEVYLPLKKLYGTRPKRMEK